MKTVSSPTEIIKRSVDIFFNKNNIVVFFKIYSPLVPFQVLYLFQNYYLNSQFKLLGLNSPQEVFSKNPWFLVWVIALNVLSVFVSFIVELASITAMPSIVSGKKVGIKKLFKNAWTKILPFAVLLLLVGLLQVGGLLLLIIPGVLFTVWFGFSKFIFVEKNTGITDSLRQSKNLVKGSFWKVLGRLALFILFTFAVQTAFAFIPYGVGAVVVQLFGGLILLPYYLLYTELRKPN